jgi:hypothetical protein
MLAYTAVDGLRAISRDFDLDWQPNVTEDRTPIRPNWQTGLRASQRVGRRALGAFLALLPIGEIVLQR